MDAIYGVTLEMLAEIMSKQSELRAQFGDRQSEGHFNAYLASRGLDSNTYAHAHNGWQQRFSVDPTGQTEARFHNMLAQASRKIHFGDVRDMSADKVEGITLDQYAQICVAVSRQGVDADALVRQFGLTDVAHWQRANAAWAKKMGEDKTHALSMQYGELYGKYAGPQFAKETTDRMAADLARHNAPRDVVREPEVPLTPELCLEKMKSPSRNERWKYAAHYARMADLGNVPDKNAAIATVTPILIEMIEQHDEHTTNDAETGVRYLWDLGVRNSDIPGDIARCLGRAKEKLTSLQAAFAPIQNQAVPERIPLQSRIQDYTSLVETMQDYAAKDWVPAAVAAHAGASQRPPGAGARAPAMPQMGGAAGGFPKWIIAPIVLVVVGGAMVFARSGSSSSPSATDAPPAAAAAAPAAADPGTKKAPAANAAAAKKGGAAH